MFSRTHTWPSPFVQNLGRSMHFTAPIMKNNEKGEVTKRTKIAKGHNSCSWTIKNKEFLINKDSYIVRYSYLDN